MIDAQTQLGKLIHDIEIHNAAPPDPTNGAAVADYNREAEFYNNWVAQLEGELSSQRVEHNPAPSAKIADVPPWTQPAPPAPPHQHPTPPQRARDVLEQIDAGKWPGAAKAPGTKGGRGYRNSDERLPTTDASGKPITYQEWDVNPKVPGEDRDDERIVTGSDGSAWYTPDHYDNFQRLR